MKRILLALLLTVTSSALYAGEGEVQVNGDQRPYSVKFIDEMTAHHKGGVMMAELAVEKAFHSELREIAKSMANMQRMEIAELQNLRTSLFPRVGAFESKDPGMNMEKLASLEGNEFDLAFLDAMILHHPGAIYLGIEAKARSSKRDIRELGAKIEKMQKQELRELRTWRDDWSRE